MRKRLIALSGGMDSATALGIAKREAEAGSGWVEVVCAGFRYGSKHNEYENMAAEKLAVFYGVKFILIDLAVPMRHFQSDLLLSGGEIPEGHYTDASMSRTVVPGRNAIFISFLAGLAWSIGAGEVWLGIHAGDHAIYPDCRPEFFHSMRRSIELATEERVYLRAPFLNDTKADIVRQGVELGVPYGMTRTCYKNQEIACGKCGSCNERREAFALAGVVDPIEYEKE